MEYLYPCIPELKYKDYQVYLAYRAGIYSRLKQEYGLAAWLLCRRETVVVFALLSDGLAGRQATVKKVRDWNHPWRTHQEMSHTRGITQATQISIFLRWFSLMETAAQPGNGKYKILAQAQQHLLKTAYEKAAKESPIVHRLFLQQWDYVQALRTTGCVEYSEAAKPMAQLYSMMMEDCADNDMVRPYLERMGEAVGSMIYLMRCVNNYTSDEKLGRYNIYLRRGVSFAAAVENAQRQCYQACAELARAYHNLIFLLHRDLIENILIHGSEQAILSIGETTKEKL